MYDIKLENISSPRAVIVKYGRYAGQVRQRYPIVRLLLILMKCPAQNPYMYGRAQKFSLLPVMEPRRGGRSESVELNRMIKILMSDLGFGPDLRKV